MNEITYKLRQLNEEWKVFGDHVVRMHVDYEITITAPRWINVKWMRSTLSSFENLEYQDIETGVDRGTVNYIYRIQVSSIAKCNLTKDKFDETTGIYICETRAEIKALEKVKRIIDSMYKLVKDIETSQTRIDNLIDQRINKNIQNLEINKNIQSLEGLEED